MMIRNAFENSAECAWFDGIMIRDDFMMFAVLLSRHPNM